MGEGEQSIVPIEGIVSSIVVFRGQKVILDADLAKLYGTSTTRLNEQVKRNPARFPVDFMFQLTDDEFRALISQNATSKPGRGGRRKRPYAFTEHGAVMAASVLNTPQAVEVSVYVVRAFIQLRGLLAAHEELAGKLAELEIRLDSHDDEIALLVEAIRELAMPPEGPRRRIGFRGETGLVESSIGGE